MEKWAAVPGFEDFYKVSNTGQVKSISRKETTSAGWSRVRSEKLLRQTLDKSGRFYVDFCTQYQRQRWYVHRLVLTVFVGPCPDGMEACHNNGEQTDNSIENLRWDTHRNNMRDKIAHETHIRGQDHKGAKLHEADIPRIRELHKLGWTQQKIGEFFGVSRRLIGGILAGKKWDHA